MTGDKLLDLIGTANGAKMPFSEWVVEARAQQLRPELVQRYKRKGLLHTVLDEHGHVWIVLGKRPTT